MKALVIYDSHFGNTKSVAVAIGNELQARVVSVSSVTTADIEQADLLVIGSPINTWRPTPAIQDLLGRLGAMHLSGVQGAAFDTRMKLWISGDAATRIARAMVKNGITLVASPRAFYVAGKEGPLLVNELENARSWAHLLLQNVTAATPPVVQVISPGTAGRTIRIILAVLTLFIGLNAVGGGLYGITGAKDIPLEWLKRTPFASYFLPALFLFVVVGGMCLYTAVSLFTNGARSRSLSLATAALLAAWIVVQLTMIGFVSWLQPAILLFALLILLLALKLPRKN